MTNNKIHTYISAGELIDKITILEIKIQKISDRDKLFNIITELNELYKVYIKDIHSTKKTFSQIKELCKHTEDLRSINETLWNIEDDIRIKEKEKKFDKGFIDLARSVYKTNDKRFDLKNKINKIFNSHIKEVKSYEEY
tara:strand:+ start:158 stop:574 length:417 start_codon:yes stop_codon:yes gene_type:complete